MISRFVCSVHRVSVKKKIEIVRVTAMSTLGQREGERRIGKERGNQTEPIHIFSQSADWQKGCNKISPVPTALSLLTGRRLQINPLQSLARAEGERLIPLIIDVTINFRLSRKKRERKITEIGER